jgi:hypothetical protein
MGLGVCFSVWLVSLGVGPIWPSAACSHRRVDACGCHHVYGLRHCHPNRKSKHCEMPARAKARLPLPTEQRVETL